ncbi:MAG: cob(I)yrinic acid a,c-diamide adenosyltransferase [Candidatus Poseidoniales archaeon]|nr:ATP:cob(I)alamin adenosyltransferase [Euryarchaeota archaeon]RJU93890.1 MAG: cob(I)yrinic acid a,c-diamide adenosyltransferase [Candidatus Poseidoniales archaeon]|tara:strand:+ start:1008 stop:1703 length:696 start_codon:yes stop_codon:yes gene_type:complete
MVRITRVYTGTGDEGTTSLVDGSRRSKADLRLEAVGTCDELNALFGLCLMEVQRLPGHEDGGSRSTVSRVQNIVTQVLPRIQNELFDLGAELACIPSQLPEGMAVLSENQADVLVDEMDAWLEQLEPLTSFILPSGNGPEAAVHVARTVTRRLERAVLRLLESEGEGSVRPLVLIYLNRLSDWLFVLGRWICLGLGNEESLWLPLGKRGSEKGVADQIRKLSQSDADFANL